MTTLLIIDTTQPSDYAVGIALYDQGCPAAWCENAGEWLGWIAASNDATPQERQHAETMAAEEDWRHEAESNYLGGLL